MNNNCTNKINININNNMITTKNRSIKIIKLMTSTNPIKLALLWLKITKLIKVKKIKAKRMCKICGNAYLSSALKAHYEHAHGITEESIQEKICGSCITAEKSCFKQTGNHLY